MYVLMKPVQRVECYLLFQEAIVKFPRIFLLLNVSIPAAGEC